MDEHADVVVVGSGFGGSVAAHRFAEAGRQVVVLERGKPYPPGSFARSPAAMARNLWDPSEGRHGLFDLWSFRGIDAVVSSGLGGGSLIYANVLLRKPESWFVNESPLPGGGYEHWPVTRDDLDPYYDEVERMMGAQRFPYEHAPYAASAKTAAMREAAERLGLHWELPTLAVSFAPEPGARAGLGLPIPEPSYGNLHGVPRVTCRMSSECDFGCNGGAKNTLDHTYLSAAAFHGADLRTRHEVRGFEPLPGGGYLVHYVVHDPAGEGTRTRTRRLPVRSIRCRRLVLAAGALGTTYLLLVSRKKLPALSNALGTRFSGNGDLLSLMLSARGADGEHRPLRGSTGPVITSAIRGEDGPGGRGFYVQDAGYPGFVDWLVEATQVSGQARRMLIFAWARLAAAVTRSPRTRINAQVAALIGRGSLSEASLPLLGMGRDVPDGVMRLRGRHLDVQWTTSTSRAYFDRVRGTMREIAETMDADYRDNPLWWARRVITVHPLGGAPLGRHSGEGVVDAYGEAFGHPGLHVLDGSALPGACGANPSLTIAALAERACERILTA
ncbi:cholesterol oxidase [Microtetraspora sp. NBRC 13810]|uniref:GMC oxidoreductase n=1 Tax=Microtetraspora sp. NBRC 13810 TaxID=3030990 RepID=UPI0024A3802F|nr:GMC oxidoreductase [Microtetraspora sp. NBRC 13810]GLW05162.1 cholesterol oxidase [Microtetraspora sp. NBRC 13810]